MKYLSISLWVLIISQANCVKPVSYLPLGNVTKIIVEDNQGTMIREISDLVQIKSIVHFVDQQKDNWGSPIGGVPVARIRVMLYDGDTLRCSFGVGSSFFVTQRAGDFKSKQITEKDKAEFLSLISIRQPKS